MADRIVFKVLRGTAGDIERKLNDLAAHRYSKVTVVGMTQTSAMSICVIVQLEKL